MNYESKCLKKLKELGAPLEEWDCVEMIDGELPTFECELCGYEKVRYIHTMRHVDFERDLRVGCICAGVMEGDELAAKERDRKMKNRAKRRRNFIKKEWEKRRYGLYTLEYKGHRLAIEEVNAKYRCSSDESYTWYYKDKHIRDFLSACYAVFDLVDPIEEVME